jgi:hypothetical protein
MTNNISLGRQRTTLDVVERADPTNTTRTERIRPEPASISRLEALEMKLSMSEKAKTKTLAMTSLRFCLCTKLTAMIGPAARLLQRVRPKTVRNS